MMLFDGAGQYDVFSVHAQYIRVPLQATYAEMMLMSPLTFVLIASYKCQTKRCVTNAVERALIPLD